MKILIIHHIIVKYFYKYLSSRLFINRIYWIKILDIISNAEEELRLPVPNNEQDITNNINRVKNFYTKLTNLHPYFYALSELFNKKIEDYISDTSIFIQQKNLSPHLKVNLEFYFDEIVNEIIGLQETSCVFYDAVNFILDIDKHHPLKNLSYLQRFYLYKSVKNNFDITVDDTPINILYKVSTAYDVVNPDVQLDPHYVVNVDELIKTLPEEPLNLYEIYDLTIDATCYLELVKLITKDIKIKKCAHCDKYFIIKGRSDTMYCDRIIDKDDRTCKEVGPLETYRNKTKDDPIMVIYNRAYKKYSARVRYKKMTPKEFAFWSKKALDLKDEANNGKISVEKFAELLNKD